MKLSSWMFLAISLTAISIGCRASALPAPADPFVGDWKLNPSRTKAIDMMKVQSVNGDTFAFEFEGGGGETVVVDGTDQPGISGTTLAVTALGPDHWKVVRKKDGHMLITAMWTLSQDGKTLSDDYTEFAPDGQVSVHATYLYQRTADGQGFAGTWETPVAIENIPSSVLQIRTYEASGLSFTLPVQDVTRNFKFDGKDYPLVGHGVAEGSTSSARRVDERMLELTDKNKGKVKRTEQIELSRDLKTLIRTVHPVGQHGPNILVFERQSPTTRS
jgi:hypothetical protein